MAKIIDPDQLNQGTEIVINTTAKTIELIAAGLLDNTSPGSTSGVSLQAVYSFLKEEWKSDASLNKFRFPLTAIYEAKFVTVNSWNWADGSTRSFIRDAGWLEEVTDAEYATIITLGSMDNELADQAYYQNVSGFDASILEFDKTGPLNEAIQIFDGSLNDNRSYLKAFLREQGKTYDLYNLLIEQNFSALTYIAYRLPLSNATDIKILYTDASIATIEPFISMQLQYYVGNRFEEVSTGTINYTVDDVVMNASTRWFRCVSANTPTTDASLTNTTYWEVYPGERQIGDFYYAFNREIIGSSTNLPDATEIYAFAQYKLRQPIDINDDPSTELYGIVYGNVANPLCYFVGDTLWSEPGVWFQNFDANITNSVVLQSIDAASASTNGLDSEDVPKEWTARTFPFVAAGNIVFNSILQDDTDAEYWMYFTDANGNAYDTSTAIIVNNALGVPITGTVPSSPGIVPFTFDYDNNIQGGRTPQTPAPVVIVAMGLQTAEWIAASFTITRATGLTFPVNANLERNYLNPA